MDDKEIIPDGRYALEVTKTLVAVQKSLASRGLRQLIK
jgi:hypothetical protein